MERKHIEEKARRCWPLPGGYPGIRGGPAGADPADGLPPDPGMLCAMRRPRLPSVAEVCANARRIAVLENIMNPTNIGAISGPPPL